MVENKGSAKEMKAQKHKTTIENVVENLGAHGIPNIKRAKSTKRKLFWLLMFLGGLSAFSIHCYKSINKYLAYDVTVNLDIRYKPTLVFPAVTFCNLNPIKESALMNFTDLDDLLGSGARGTMLPANTLVTTEPNPTQRSPRRPTVPAISAPSPTKRYQDWDDTDFNAMDPMHTLIEDTANIVGALDYTEKIHTGHTIEEMLLSCTFQGFPCAPGNFTWFYNYLYGNCYTFNSGAMSDPLEVSKAGPLYGLTITLYIEQDEYISDIQQGAGVRVDIHSQNEMSFPEDEGVNVSPGTEAFIGVKMMCEKDCFYREVLKECGCADVRYRYDDSTVACNSSVPRVDQCVDEVETNYTHGRTTCDCTLACREDQFKPTVSYSLWPNDEYKPVVQEGIRQISDSLRESINNDTNFVEHNVVKINVFYEELTYDYIYQTETYGRYALMSDIGGNVGLWIGISVLTIVELLELAYDIAMLCLLKAKSAGERSPPKQNVMNSSDVELVDRTDPALRTSSIFDEKKY